MRLPYEDAHPRSPGRGLFGNLPILRILLVVTLLLLLASMLQLHRQGSIPTSEIEPVIRKPLSRGGNRNGRPSSPSKPMDISNNNRQLNEENDQYEEEEEAEEGSEDIVYDPLDTPSIYDDDDSEDVTETKPVIETPKSKEKQQPSTSSVPLKHINNAAVVILAYNRPEYLQRTLDALTKALGVSQLSVYISQDGDLESVASVARSFPEFRLLQRQRPSGSMLGGGTAALARHYRHILNRVFVEFKHSHVILLEDDMLVSPDIFLFFDATAPLLQTDPTLFCVSSWNDNGFSKFDLDPKRMFRNSFFPGLGWMMRREFWDEIGPIWPEDHWDHWMRSETIHKGRECLAPEVSRNFNIGEQGANVHSLEYSKYFKDIQYATDPVHSFDVKTTAPSSTSTSSADGKKAKQKQKEEPLVLSGLDYLKPENYDAYVTSLIAKGRIVSTSELIEEVRRREGIISKAISSLTSLLSSERDRDVVVVPYLREEYNSLASIWGLWDVPRTHHKLATLIRYKGTVFVLVDKRSSPFVPESHRLTSKSSLKAVAATQTGKSCREVCETQAKASSCDPSQFDFINTCSELAKHFKCDKGCGREWGSDIPNYVPTHVSDRNAGKCLVTEVMPDCDSRHPNTMRLCPCIVPN